MRNQLLYNTESEGGGGNVTITNNPVGSVQIQALQGSPASPVSNNEKPVPAEMAGKTFDIEGLGGDIEYPDHPESHKQEQNVVTEDKVVKKEEPKLEEKKSEEAKTEEKKGLKSSEIPKKEDIQKQDAKVEGKENTKENRDYSLFPEEIRGTLKGTSNEAFKLVSDIYKTKKDLEEKTTKYEAQLKQLDETGIPNEWTSHPDAWRIHPHAQETISKISKVEFEENFWIQQLNKINNGEKFNRLQGYTKEGNPVYSPSIEPSVQEKDAIMMSLGKYGSIKTQLYQGLNSFAQNFHGQIQKQTEVVNKLVDEHFPWHKDEKDARQENYKLFVETVVPIERRSDPLARVAGMLYANLQNALDLLVEKQSIDKKESVKQENRKSVEPSPRTGGITRISKPVGMNGKAGYTPPTTFSLDGM